MSTLHYLSVCVYKYKYKYKYIYININVCVCVCVHLDRCQGMEGMVSESSVGPAMAVAAFLQGPKKICQEDGLR